MQKDPSKYCNKCGGKKSAWSGKGAHAKTCPNYAPPERNGSPDRKHKKGTDRGAERTSTKRVQFAGADDDDDSCATDDEVTSSAFMVRVRVSAVAKRDACSSGSVDPDGSFTVRAYADTGAQVSITGDTRFTALPGPTTCNVLLETFTGGRPT